MDIIKKVEENIKKYDMIKKGQTIIVGVSGGFDSITLLDILYKIKDKYGFKLIVAHVNHGVRGVEADSDEIFVKQRAKKYGLEFISTRIDMNEYAKKNKISKEEAGRKLRYKFFNSIEKDKEFKIAVAHNKNDQAETLLMRLIRGTGLDGLTGINYKSQNIIRPLLNIERKEIEKYCKQKKLNPRIDKTNLMPIYERNKVRLKLIPYIEENFSENIVETLYRLSEIAKNDVKILEEFTDSKLKKLMLEFKQNKLILDIKEFNKLDMGVKSRVLRKAINNVNGNLAGIEENKIINAINFIREEKTGKSIDINKNIKIRINYNKLNVEKCEKDNKVRYNYKIAINQEIEISEINVKIKLSVKSIQEVGKERKKSQSQQYFDYDKIEEDIYIRNRIDGDKVKFLGIDGYKKLKNYFIDEKIERKKRDNIPLLLFGNKIAWIIGYRRANIALLNKNTKNVLIVEIENLDI